MKRMRTNYVLDEQGKPMMDDKGEPIYEDGEKDKEQYSPVSRVKEPIPVPYESPVPPEYALKKTASVKRLKELNFDPLDEQVKIYRRLKTELEMQEKIRRGEVLKVNAKGELIPVQYSGVAHSSLLAQLQKCAADLMRYKYGRVPESMEFEIKETQGMIIQLPREDGSYMEIEK